MMTIDDKRGGGGLKMPKNANKTATINVVWPSVIKMFDGANWIQTDDGQNIFQFNCRLVRPM